MYEVGDLVKAVVLKVRGRSVLIDNNNQIALPVVLLQLSERRYDGVDMTALTYEAVLR